MVSDVGYQDGMTMSDQMDLLVEQVKLLAGEIAFSSSTLKRLVEQSANDPESSKDQVKFHCPTRKLILKITWSVQFS